MCGLLLVSAGPGIAATKIRFRLVQDHLIVVPLVVNGAGPFEFLLDTGTTTTIIDAALAAELRLKAADRLNLVTLAGVKPLPRSWLETVSLAGASATHVEALWGSLDELKAINKTIRGILGLNFLDGFNYMINYRDKTFEVESGSDGPPGYSGAKLNVDRIEGKLLVTTRTRTRASSSLRLSVDSGVGAPIIYTSTLRKLPHLIAAPDFDAGLASTLGGGVQTQMGRLEPLVVGEQTISGLTAAVLAKVDPESQVEDGVLPTILFRSIYFNNREGYIVLNPVASRNLESKSGIDKWPRRLSDGSSR